MGKKKTRFKNAFGWSRFLLGEGSLPSFTSSSFERESRITMRSVVVVSTPFLRSSSSSLFPRWGKQDSRHGRHQKKKGVVSTFAEGPSRRGKRRAVVVLAKAENGNGGGQHNEDAQAAKHNLARRLGAAAIVSAMVFFGGQKSAANAKRLDETSASSKATSANSRSSERNEWRNRVEGEVASSSSGGEGRNADDGAFQSIANLKPHLSLRGGFEANEAVGNVAAGSTKEKKKKKKKKTRETSESKKDPSKKRKSDKDLWSFVEPKEEAAERTRLFRKRFGNDVRKMPTGAMTDEEGAEARKWKRETD